MKKFLIDLSLVLVLVLTLIGVGCKEERALYDGPNYILFSDSLYIFPVQNNEDYFEIPISATRAYDYDRTLAVEVIDKKSNAIEKVHYALESNTVTIKAGELSTNVRVRGFYDNIAVTDSLGFSLRLVSEEDTQWDIYGIDANVLLKKIGWKKHFPR